MREIILRLTDEQAEELAYATESHAEQHGEDDEKAHLTEELDSLVGAAIDEAKTGERVYLALNNTDAGGTAYVIEFPSTGDYEGWSALSLLDNEQPFGFRGEWGLAHAILTPDRALEVLDLVDEHPEAK
jgi:hypothetical protein